MYTLKAYLEEAQTSAGMAPHTPSRPQHKPSRWRRFWIPKIIWMNLNVEKIKRTVFVHLSYGRTRTSITLYSHKKCLNLFVSSTFKLHILQLTNQSIFMLELKTVFAWLNQNLYHYSIILITTPYLGSRVPFPGF